MVSVGFLKKSSFLTFSLFICIVTSIIIFSPAHAFAKDPQIRYSQSSSLGSQSLSAFQSTFEHIASSFYSDFTITASVLNSILDIFAPKEALPLSSAKPAPYTHTAPVFTYTPQSSQASKYIQPEVTIQRIYASNPDLITRTELDSRLNQIDAKLNDQIAAVTKSFSGARSSFLNEPSQPGAMYTTPILSGVSTIPVSFPAVAFVSQGHQTINNSIITSSSIGATDLTVTGTATSTFAGDLSVNGNFNFNGELLENGLPFVGSQWTTNSGNIFFNTGNVGIGTTTPSAKLSVDGDLAVTGISNLATTTITGALTVIGNTTITQGGVLTVGDKIIAPGDIGVGTSTPAAKLAIQSTNAAQTASLIYGASGQTAPLFDVFDDPLSNKNLFRIASNGNVGIGTTTPSSKLTVVGTTTADQFNTANGLSITDEPFWNNPGFKQISLKNPDNTYANLQVGTIKSDSVFFGAGGINGGGGVAADSGAGAMRADALGVTTGDSTNGDGYYFHWNGTDSLFLNNAANNPNPTNLRGLRVSKLVADGSMGIGTTSPSGQFQVHGDGDILLDSKIVGSGYSGLWFGSAAANPTGNNFAFLGRGDQTIFNAPAGGSMNFRIGNAYSPSAMVIDSSGNVGIGTAAPSAKLQINSTQGGTPLMSFHDDTSNETANISLQAPLLYENPPYLVFDHKTGFSSGIVTPSVSGDNLAQTLNLVGANSSGGGTIIAQSGRFYVKTNYDNTILFDAGHDVGNTTIRPYSSSNNILLAPDGGNVGIGTQNPQAKFSINDSIGAINFHEPHWHDGAHYLATYADSSSMTSNPDTIGLNLQNTDDTVGAYTPTLLFSAKVPSGNLAAGVAAITAIKGVGKDSNWNSGSLVFYTADSSSYGLSEKMRLDKDGNLGIGTMSPGYKLDISDSNNLGSVRITGSGGGGFILGSWSSNTGGFWSNGLTPSATNYSLLANSAGDTFLNAASGKMVQIINANGTNPGQLLVNQYGVSINNGLVGATSGNGLIVGSGNVGIGTTAPNSLLSVAGNIDTTGNLNFATTTTSGLVTVSKLNGDRFISLGTLGDSTFVGDNAGGTSISGAGNTGFGKYALRLITSGYRNVAFGRYALQFVSTGVDNTALGDSALSANNGNGNVAVGFCALCSNADGGANVVLGDNAMADATTGSSNVVIGNGAGYHQISGNSNILIGNLAYAPSSTGSNQLNIGNLIYGTGLDGYADNISSGNIGIGTKNPQAKLDVNGNAVVNGYFTVNTGNVIGQSYSGGTPGVGLNVTSSDGGGAFFSQDINHSIFFRKGNDGVNDATTYYEYGGNLAQGKGHRFYTGGFIGNQTLKMQIANDGIYMAGNVGIGTTSPAYKLDVAGDINASGAIYDAAGTIQTSDRRLKQDITTSSLGLDFINKLQPVQYQLISDAAGKTHYGFIAQDVMSELGLSTSTLSQFGGLDYSTTTDRFGLSYTDFIAPTVKAVQELSAKVDTLEAASSSSASIASVPQPALMASVITGFESLGAKFEQGIATFASLVTDSLTAKTVVVNDAQIQTAKIETAQIGTAFIQNSESDNGITTKDQATGAYYCIVIRNGALTAIPDKCTVHSTELQSLAPSTPSGVVATSTATTTDQTVPTETPAETATTTPAEQLITEESTSTDPTAPISISGATSVDPVASSTSSQ